MTISPYGIAAIRAHTARSNAEPRTNRNGAVNAVRDPAKYSRSSASAAASTGSSGPFGGWPTAPNEIPTTAPSDTVTPSPPIGVGSTASLITPPVFPGVRHPSGNLSY